MSSDEDVEIVTKKSKIEEIVEISDEEDGENCGIEIIRQESGFEPKINDEKCEETMRSFAEITNTDEILAQSILQDVNWDLKRALDIFYGSDSFKQQRTEAVMGGPSSSASKATENIETIDLTGFEISVMSWNIDGLDGRSLSTRMKAVAKIIKMVNSDIVFLQEVVDRELEPIDKLKSLYDIYYSNKGCQYYTAILVSKMFEVEKHDVIHYKNSGMYRTLQIIEGSIGSLKIFLLNTHLESMKEHSNQRRAQFAFCMDKVRELIQQNPGCYLFFGGDLNLRDDEVTNIPPNVQDAWISAGAEIKHKFTWDTRHNDNKQGFGARLRFDRIYWHGKARKVQFSLEGRNRIRSCLCFPSDHWAINAIFTA